MSSALASVIIASAQSVAKVFLIGGVGYAAVLFPRKAPFLPRNLVGPVARFTFHTLLLPLLYGTIASAVTIESIGNYWFVIVGGFIVVGLSYLVCTLLQYVIPIASKKDFYALRVAATFPNIVALPILIFPSLCEFPVVHEGYIPHDEGFDDSVELERQCIDQANTMIFCYFFSWSLAFWTFGSPQLLEAAKLVENSKKSDEGSSVLSIDGGDNAKALAILPSKDDGLSKTDRTAESSSIALDQSRKQNVSRNETHQSTDEETANKTDEDSNGNNDDSSQEEKQSTGIAIRLLLALKQTVTSPGFVAMLIGFVTACIPPLQRALFEAGAPLRFLGSAIETLGSASSSISTMVVAASLVPPETPDEQSAEDGNDERDDSADFEENPAMTDPNFGPYRRKHLTRQSSRFQQLRRSMRSGSVRLLNAMPRSSPEMRRIHLWFCLSRLFITPALVVGIIAAMDCGSDMLINVPNLAKLVMIINSALPGALIVVVILKSKKELEDSATAMSKVYLPSYLISIVTIAGWTAVGMWVTLPDENGDTLCRRY